MNPHTGQETAYRVYGLPLEETRPWVDVTTQEVVGFGGCGDSSLIGFYFRLEWVGRGGSVQEI